MRKSSFKFYVPCNNHVSQDRIELPFNGCKPFVLPVNYWEIKVDNVGIEPKQSVCKTVDLPLASRPFMCILKESNLYPLSYEESALPVKLKKL